MKDVVIGLDIGTSSVKAAGFDLRGRLLGRAAEPVATQFPHPGWVEQEPADWWKAACIVLEKLLNGIHPDRVAAVGLSGQCPTHALVDTECRPIGWAILWQDQRAVEEAAWLAQNITSSQALHWVGSSFLADATCPPARLLWLKNHRREDWERAVAVLQPKDFIALQLTGKLATDRHSAYCLLNPQNDSYEKDFFAALDLQVEKLPAALPPTAVVGHVTGAAGQTTKLAPGTPVVIGTIDAYCDNLAGGISCPGRAVDVAGTSEIISLNIEAKISAEGVFPAELGDCKFLCGPTQAGGDTLRWLSKAFFSENGSVIDYERLELEAAGAPAGCEGLVFLPYLNGERAPLWDASARGAFIGLTFLHDRRHFTRAAYESVGFAIRHILEIAEMAAGRQAEEMVICGGGSRSRFWNQVKADILQKPVRPTAVTETGCLGAAILAAVGAGLYPDIESACKNMIVFLDPFIPDPSLKDLYGSLYKVYRNCHPVLQKVLP
jgi:xylulokinase